MTALGAARHDKLTRAVKLDPYFAEAHAKLGNNCFLIYTYLRNTVTLKNFEFGEFHARRSLEAICVERGS